MASNQRVAIGLTLPVTCKSTLTERGVLLIHDTAEGEAKLPGGSDAGSAAGIGIWEGEDAVSGDEIELTVTGVTMVRVNGNSVNIAKGDMLKVAATTGRLVKAATDLDYYYAKALQASTADGDLIAAVLMQGYLGA